MELILHPGMPKCGSSSIQEALIRSADKLADNNIFVLDKYFSLSYLNGRDSKHGVPYNIIYDVLDGRVKLVNLIDDIKSYLGSIGKLENSKIILSSELLSDINGESRLKFHKELNSLFDNVSLWIYVRAPWNQFFSNWRQGVYREGISFKTYTEKRMKESRTRNFWGERLAEFYNIYTQINVVAIESVGDVKEHFFKNAICINDTYQLEKNSNPSLCPILCDALSLNSDYFKNELLDKEYKGYRHKNQLMDELNNMESTIFSNKCTQEHIESLLNVKSFYEDEYIKFVSSSESDSLRISKKLKAEIEKYKHCVVQDEKKDNVYAELVFDFLNIIKNKCR